jgi:hypothetical protein
LKILSHRGYWKAATEKNTEVAFRRSFNLGFGTETDVRDTGGRIVISHDPPTGGEMSADDCFTMMADRGLPMALNIKADGIAHLVRAEAKRAGLTDWFVFDMSLPDTLQQIKAGNPVFARMSEYEPDTSLTRACPGIWLDAFEGEWYGPVLLRELLGRGQRVCIVSPELHGRSHMALWTMLREFRAEDGLMLCTDLPQEAASMLLIG